MDVLAGTMINANGGATAALPFHHQVKLRAWQLVQCFPFFPHHHTLLLKSENLGRGAQPSPLVPPTPAGLSAAAGLAGGHWRALSILSQPAVVVINLLGFTCATFNPQPPSQDPATTQARHKYDPLCSGSAAR
ncbi:hypothetical protein E2C01_035723 [Portunus trituberculatus]|uniref:Uncharacterized protein n=1 Tax=Portunus trituberculatus TaxID=210409 RepID=A0A5B7FA37_PORTR|nr:hypothetical protein [Portunus trituberculatus]